MRVSYTPEQKAKAIEVYNETKSYAKTLRILGYPSRHVLFDWVKNPGSKPKPKQPERPAKRYAWELKGLAVAKVLSGGDIKLVAQMRRRAPATGPMLFGKVASETLETSYFSGRLRPRVRRYSMTTACLPMMLYKRSNAPRGRHTEPDNGSDTRTVLLKGS